MLVTLLLWNLADSKTNVDELRRYLQAEAVDPFDGLPGLVFKAWVSDEVTERWGAIFVWESREAAEQELPSSPRDLIGKDPEIAELFDLEARCPSRQSSSGSGSRSTASSTGTSSAPPKQAVDRAVGGVGEVARDRVHGDPVDRDEAREGEQGPGGAERRDADIAAGRKHPRTPTTRAARRS